MMLSTASFIGTGVSSDKGVPSNSSSSTTPRLGKYDRISRSKRVKSWASVRARAAIVNTERESLTYVRAENGS
jgi:hypothetical protein